MQNSVAVQWFGCRVKKGALKCVKAPSSICSSSLNVRYLFFWDYVEAVILRKDTVALRSCQYVPSI